MNHELAPSIENDVQTNNFPTRKIKHIEVECHVKRIS